VVGRRGGGGTTSSAGGVWAVGGAGGAEVRSREEEEEEDGWRRTDVSLTRDGRDRAEEEYYCGVTRSPFGATGRAIRGSFSKRGCVLKYYQISIELLWLRDNGKGIF
jgi:hypothetical protein